MQNIKFERLRQKIGAHRKIDLPWKRGSEGWTTEYVDGIEVIVRPLEGNSFVLEFIHVKPEDRRKGLAKNKLKQILMAIKELDMNCYLFVSPENAVSWAKDPQDAEHPDENGIKRLYRKLGFRQIGDKWMVYNSSEHKDAKFDPRSFHHRHPKEVPNLKTLKSGLRDGELKDGAYTNGSNVWAVDKANNIRKIDTKPPEYDWHRMRYNSFKEYCENVLYTDIGHKLPDGRRVVLWIIHNGNLEFKDITIDYARTKFPTHDRIWDAYEIYKDITGRYDPETKTASIAFPVNFKGTKEDAEKQTRSWIVPMLREKFDVNRYHFYI
jgi:GNAT superfamily N-acetyltransferase